MAKQEHYINKKLGLNDVRLSFPHLFKPHAFNEGDDGKYQCMLMLNKETNNHEIEACLKLIKDVNTELEKNGLKPLKDAPINNMFLRDGDDEDQFSEWREEYKDHYIIGCSNVARPTVQYSDRTPVDAENANDIYAGCYVFAGIEAWYQNNQWGKGLNAKLHLIRFKKDGERLGGELVEASDFDEWDNDEWEG